MLVVLFCLHTICVGSSNKTSPSCDDTDSCVTLCCNRELSENSCGQLSETQVLEFVNFTAFEGEFQLSQPCETMRKIEDDLWSFEVILSRLNLGKECNFSIDSRASSDPNRRASPYIRPTIVYFLQLIRTALACICLSATSHKPETLKSSYTRAW
jgi:hypothetical protein